MQIPVIDADECRSRCQRNLKLSCIMHFNQGIHTKALSNGTELCKPCSTRCGSDNQQDCIRPKNPSLINLNRINDEVLAQEWQCNRIPHLLEVIRASLEIRNICEDTQTRRSTLFIRLCNRFRVEIGTNYTLAGTRLLDFGNQSTGRPRGFDCFAEATRGWHRHRTLH